MSISRADYGNLVRRCVWFQSDSRLDLPHTKILEKTQEFLTRSVLSPLEDLLKHFGSLDSEATIHLAGFGATSTILLIWAHGRLRFRLSFGARVTNDRRSIVTVLAHCEVRRSRRSIEGWYTRLREGCVVQKRIVRVATEDLRL